MKTIVYVEKEKFLRDMMERAVIGAGMRLYTYADDDCMHFIDDLEPAAVLLDLGTVDEEFIKRISTQIPIFVTGFTKELETLSLPVRGQIEKPLEPFTVLALLNEI